MKASAAYQTYNTGVANLQKGILEQVANGNVEISKAEYDKLKQNSAFKNWLDTNKVKIVDKPTRTYGGGGGGQSLIGLVTEVFGASSPLVPKATQFVSLRKELGDALEPKGHTLHTYVKHAASEGAKSKTTGEPAKTPAANPKKK